MKREKTAIEKIIVSLEKDFPNDQSFGEKVRSIVNKIKKKERA